MTAWLSDTVIAHVERVTEEPDLSATRYELVELIGRGGMGSVWLAKDRELDREVAVKVTSGELPGEAKVMAQLEHPGIVPVHETGTLPDGRVYFVMKRVRGQRLDEWAVKVDLKARLRLFQRICEAVAFAHARGTLHRDLKPQNVMVGEFGEALVMDWGLAHAPGVAGTPAFMAPEAARGEPATKATDVYGLGALLNALVSGIAPPPVAAICARAMAAAPGDRYESPTALAEDVGRFLEQERVVAYREPLLERAARFASRNAVVLSLLSAYLLLRLVLLLF